jgi:hypothetical protein
MAIIKEEIITEYGNIHKSLFPKGEDSIEPDSQWFDDESILPDNILRIDKANEAEIKELSPENQQRYLEFLKFVNSAINSAYSPEEKNVVTLHIVPNISPEDLAKVNKKHSIYEDINAGGYSDEKPIYFKPTLLEKNDEYHESKKEIYFDNKNKNNELLNNNDKIKNLLNFLEERIQTFKSCNIKSIDNDKLNLFIQTQIEIMEKLIREGNTKITNDFDYINFMKKILSEFRISFTLYSLPEQLTIDDVKKYEDFFNNDENNQDFEMMRANLGEEEFSNIWNKDDKGEWKLTDDFKKHYGTKYNNNHYRQLVYGFQDEIKIYEQMPHFYWCMNFFTKLRNDEIFTNFKDSCKTIKHVGFMEDNLSVDYLLPFIFSYSNGLFPIIFKIPISPQFKNKQDDNTLILNIRKSKIYNLQTLFNNYKFCGITLIKHKFDKSSNTFRLWFILYFINDKKKIIKYSIDKTEIEYLLNKKNITYKELLQLNNYLLLNKYIYNDFNKIYYSRNDINLSNLNKVNVKSKYDKTNVYFTYTKKLVGGYIKTNIKVNFSKNLNNLYDNNICSIFHNYFMNYHINQYKTNKDYSIFYKKSRIEYLYKYIFSNELNIKTNILVKFSKNYNIIKYIPIYHIYYRIYEILNKYFINENISSISNIGGYPVIIEVLNQLNININTIDIYSVSIKDNLINYNDYLKKINNIYKYNIKKINNNIDYSLLIDDTIKYKLVIYNNYIDLKGIKLLYGFMNDINLFLGLIFIIKHTVKGGHAILNISHIYNKNQADIYLILKRYFEFSELYYPEISNMYKHSGTIAIFKGFKGCPKQDLDELYSILEKIKKEYPNGSSDLNIYDPEIRKRYFITKPMKPVDKRSRYITDGYLDIPSTDKAYDEIREFNTQRYFKQYLFVKKLDELAEIPANKLPKLPTQEQITASMLYLRKWNIPHYPFKTEEYLNETFLTDIYENIVPIHTKVNTPYQSFILGKYKPLSIKPISKKTKRNNKSKQKQHSKTKKLSLKTNNESSSIAGLLMQLDLDEIDEQLNDIYDKYEVYKSLEEELSDSNASIERVGLYIDSRRDFTEDDPQKQIAKYDKYKKRYRFYNPSDRKLRLTNVIESEYRTGVISQAYLKMWEILDRCQLIQAKTHRGGYKSFHLCEAPGMFIRAVHDYCITHGIKRHEWNGQSLNPREGGFSDNYGYIRKYSKQWVWGDITKLATVRKYISDGVASGINLITSDCGLPWGDPRYYNAACCSLMAMLMLLPVGGDLVYKIILPAKPVLWNLVYICYQYFQEVEFYKPVQNYQSREFYIIGKKFLGIPAELVMRFEHIFENYSDDIDLYGDQYPEPFVLQMKRFTKVFASNYVNAIEKQIFVMDNADLIEGKRIEKLIFNGIKEKNRKWVKDFGFRAIQNPKQKF